MLFLVTVAALLASANAAVSFEDCGSTAIIERVGVSGCKEDATECVLERNTNVTISIDFTPTAAVSGLKAQAHIILIGEPLPFGLPQVDACQDSGITCPIKGGEKVSYRTPFPVLKIYPRVRGDLGFYLIDAGTNNVVCVRIPTKIK